MDQEKLKLEFELNYWKSRYMAEGNNFKNAHYRDWMLRILEVEDESIFQDKNVVDFGCGPRGSLHWLQGARTKVGLDVLVPQYIENFANDMKKHGMLYVPTTEMHIPLPDGYADMVFTINSFDHVRFPRLMAKEIMRIMKPGALFGASFNLYEPPTSTEPQTLTMEDIEKHFLPGLDDVRMRFACKANPAYDNLLANKLLDKPDPSRPCILWLSATRK